MLQESILDRQVNVKAGQGVSPTVREGSPNVTMRDFDYNEFPLAYLITFRCYGTWLHGDKRGSYRRSSQVIEGVIRIPPRPRLRQAEVEQLRNSPTSLNEKQRSVVEQAIREVCRHRRYTLRAINVRTNHAHVVVSTLANPEHVLGAFKSYSTRALRNSGLLNSATKQWSRHGSTIYLWKETDVAKAIEYVLLGQDYPFVSGVIKKSLSPPSRSG